MSFQWLTMRISEERDRREREAMIIARLPRAIDQLFKALELCVTNYTEVFGQEAAGIQLDGAKIRVAVMDHADGEWQPRCKVEVGAIPSLPGFHIERPGIDALIIEVGLLPGDKMFFRDREVDQFLTMDELTRRILDRAFFPKLRE